MNSVQAKLALLTGAALALLPTLGWAQTAAAPAAKLDEIVVTGSRLVTNGAQAPTPVTVMTSQDLAAAEPSSLADALNDLPVFQGSTSPAKSGIGNPAVATNSNNLNLRNLGAVRALNLFDGMRLPPEAATGLVDASLVPDMLVQRVDVVTGGASAAYGSDAVSGVINFVLDKKFNGLKYNVQGGEAERGDYQSGKVGVAAGTTLANGRLHVEGSAEYYNNGGIKALTDRPLGSARWTAVGVNGLNGTAGTPANPYGYVSNVESTSISFDGMFVSGALNNKSILPNGTLVPQGGTIIGSGICVNCYAGYHDPSTVTLIPSLQTDQYFGRADYDFTDSLSGFVQGLYGHSHTYLNGSTATIRSGSTALTIFPNNAFLPASVAAQIAPTGVSFAKQAVDLGDSELNTDVKTLGLSFGLKGDLIAGWRWDADYSYGRSEQNLSMWQLDNVKLRAALDAVTGPGGSPVCNVTLTNPGLYPGCVPINMFGAGSASTAAYNYVHGVGTQKTIFDQNVVEANAHGDIFTLPAGAITGAVGFDYRTQSFNQTSNSNPGVFVAPTAIRGFAGLQYYTANYGIGSGSLNVKEGYAEVLVPIVKDLTFAKAVDLNAAVRETDYSNSGSVTTWKLGGDWQINDDVRLRVTRSRDIRAPTLVELYQGAQPAQQLVLDPHTNTQLGYTQITQGNPNLKPELADTWTYGVVVKPHWVAGLSTSLDYYNIDITNAIANPYTAAQILTLCQNSGGTSPLCTLVTRPLPYSNTTAANFPTSIISEVLNVAAVHTSGLDWEADYKTTVGPGMLDVRALANYVLNFTQQQAAGLAVQYLAGNNDGGALPQFRGTFTENYTVGPVSGGLQEQLIGAIRRSIITSYVDNNIPPVVYTNLNLTYRIPRTAQLGDAQLFLHVDNLFDVQPPLEPATNPGLSYPTLRSLYDVVGRAYTIGIRGKF